MFHPISFNVKQLGMLDKAIIGQPHFGACGLHMGLKTVPHLHQTYIAILSLIFRFGGEGLNCWKTFLK